MAPILETTKLKGGYAGVPIVRDLDLTVDAGEVVALLGPNGAGKTTTMLTLSGALPPLGGEILFGGDSRRAPLHRRARNGLSFVTEERSVFMNLTTAENLMVAGVRTSDALAFFPELESRIDVRAGLLSGGEQQMLTLARALARRPKLLLADELSLGLAPLIVQRLLEAVRSAAVAEGVGVLLVEQHVREVMKFADRAYLLRRGSIVMRGEASDLRGRIDEIEASYLSESDGEQSAT